MCISHSWFKVHVFDGVVSFQFSFNFLMLLLNDEFPEGVYLWNFLVCGLLVNFLIFLYELAILLFLFLRL